MNRICELFDIKYPLFQGGMAWIADASLASAVSNAGGIGLIAAGGAPGDWVRQEVRKAKEMTDKPFGVNVMLMSPYADEIAQVVCEEKVSLVTTGAGNPGRYIEKWKENGVKVVPVVPSVALAVRMERMGADAVIAEGCESGGHIGELTTFTLVPQVADAVTIPVLAAGGIADGRGIAASFALGAEGVQVGTRFLVAEECTVHEQYKEMVLKANDIATIVTGRGTGHPVRILKNPLGKKIQHLEKTNAPIEEIERLCTGSLPAAAKDGNLEEGSFMAGQIAGMVNKRQTCREIVEEMFSQYEALRQKA